MKIINKLLCAIGIHDWRYRNQFNRRCAGCGMHQQRMPYDMKNWFKL